MTSNILIETVKKSLLCGIVWAITNYYIRRGLDPHTKQYQEFYIDESIFGGLAVSINVVLLMIIHQII